MTKGPVWTGVPRSPEKIAGAVAEIDLDESIARSFTANEKADIELVEGDDPDAAEANASSEAPDKRRARQEDGDRLKATCRPRLSLQLFLKELGKVR